MSKILKTTLVYFSLMIVFSYMNLYAELTTLTKQDMWNKMSEEVNQWVDGIGYPIDPEIKEMVIALNLLGIKTVSSCEGHLDRGLAYPWIDIQTQSVEINEIVEELSKIEIEFDKKTKELEAKFPTLSFNNMLKTQEGKDTKNLLLQKHQLNKTLEIKELGCLMPLHTLLDEFYMNHKVNYQNILILKTDISGRLYSIGGDRQITRSYDQQLFFLNEYRKEMKSFAMFLKQKFMNDNDKVCQ